MTARTGEEYLEGLRTHPRDIWIEGEQVNDVTTHPAFARCARSIAALYDMQFDANSAKMTFPSPATGDPVGMSFLEPRTKTDLEERNEMMLSWAKLSGGMLGRTPDFLNVMITAFGAAGGFFGQKNESFGENITNYAHSVRDQDLSLTHTLVNVRKSKSSSPLLKGDDLGLRCVEETGKGIVVKGARVLATLAAISDELLVLPSSSTRTDPKSVNYALGFALPCDTKGLRFLCREGLDLGRSFFDHPLGSRFDESDALVIFDDVLVPWERVFILKDVDIANRHAAETGAGGHIRSQVIVKNIAKSQFILGLAALMTETLGTSETPHIQALASELVVTHELMKACVTASVENATMNDWGLITPDSTPLTAARATFAKGYPRAMEILQLLGSSSLMAIPTEADFETEMGGFLENYLGTDTLNGKQRTQLFRLAWDVACSSFGGRQELYERFFTGDPHRTASAIYSRYDKNEAKDSVLAMLEGTAAKVK